MPTAWLQYWTPEQIEDERRAGSEGVPLHQTASDQFGRVASGDVIYIFSRSGTSLLLISRLTIDRVLDKRTARATLGPDGYIAAWNPVGFGTVRKT